MAGKSRRSRPQELVDHNALQSASINDALEAALARIRADRTLPATQEKLAELAGCSRGTVNNRPSVVTALRDLKKERRESKATRKTVTPNASGEEAKELREQLRKSRDRALEMLNERNQLKRKYDKLQTNYKLLAENVLSLEGRLVQQGGKLPSVVQMRPTRKGR